MSTSTFVPSRTRLTTGKMIAIVWSILAFLGSIALMVYGLILAAGSFGLAAAEQRLPHLVIGIVLLVFGTLIFIRHFKNLRTVWLEKDYKRAQTVFNTDLVQLFLLLVMATVLFPVIWIFSLSIDSRNLPRTDGLTIIPPSASLDAYVKVLTQPSPNPVSFLELLRNSLLVAGGTALGTVLVGTTAAYAFSRLKFPGRAIGMLGFVLVLMIPPGGTLAPLFVLLNALHIRSTLFGLALAFTSSALPFAIWNMKGFIDSLPYDLEEAAQIDGCNRAQGFIKVILPLAVPGIAVTALMGFLTGWSEFILSWTFLSDPSTFTLPMIMRGMVGQYASGTPWAQFAAMSIIMSIPPVILFFFLQRYLISGLAVGGVKG